MTEQVGHGFNRILRQGSFKDHNIGRKLFHGGLSLRQCFRLSDYANIVFESEDLAQAGAKDSLGIGHDHSDELAFAGFFAGSEIFFRVDWNARHSVPTLAQSDTRQ